MDPTGFFSYEDIWLPGQFRATNPPRDPVPAATAAGREIFPDIARLDELVKKLPAEVAVVLVVPPTLSTKVAQPGTAEAADVRWRLGAAAEDWDQPEMDVYNDL